MYPNLELVIDGVRRQTKATRPVVNPATEEVIGQCPIATEQDLADALQAAVRGFATWRSASPYDRSKILRRGADLVRERIDQIATILTLEQGKTLIESKGEIAYSADVFDWYAEEGRRTYGRIIPSRSQHSRMMMIQEPVGPSAAFTPWNFPALTPARKIGGALAAGCSLIVKPAEETPATCLALVDALHDAGLPPGVLNLVLGVPDEISRRLIGAPEIRKFSFTGSINVGKQLLRLAADGIKRSTMELGGHAPVVVFDDVDAAGTAAACVAAKYRNAGQVCVSPTRFFVQEAIYATFVDAFVERARKLRVGAGLDPLSQMGPLANPRRVAAMERLVADARRRGGSVRCGGERLGNLGYFFEPTVVTGLPDDALAMTEEPFGPLALVVPFRTTEEVVGRANALPFGLAAYAFTQSDKRASQISAALEAGMVGLNSFLISYPETPFGGVKESGFGHEGGVEGLDAYMSRKLVHAG